MGLTVDEEVDMPVTRRVDEAETTVRSILWMGGALVGFCMAAISMRGLSVSFGAFEANAIRTGGGLLVVLIYMAFSGVRPLTVDPSNMRAHAVRNAVHWCGSLLWTASVTVLPLATVFALEFTTPMWVAVFAAVFMGRRVSPLTVVGLLVGFLGVLVVIRPDARTFDVTTVLPIMTAMFLAMSALLTKGLTRRNDVSNILFWMMSMQVVANVLAVACTVGVGAFVEKVVTVPGTGLLAASLVTGGLASQLCLAKALSAGNEVVVVSLDFLRIPLISVLGYLFFGETVGTHTFLGSAIVVAAVVVITMAREVRPWTSPFVSLGTRKLAR